MPIVQPLSPADLMDPTYGADLGSHGYLNSAAGATVYGALTAHYHYNQAARRNLKAYGAIGADGARYHDKVPTPATRVPTMRKPTNMTSKLATPTSGVPTV
ncbi:uncharacterized protein LOC143228044 [Tachypleus tridentatus]|uniref:uncharacterized protein LOC143228044 n=1 Tax=Tachypleus tridentatus TaxID=6853 RepID=UPI003FD3F2B0